MPDAMPTPASAAPSPASEPNLLLIVRRAARNAAWLLSSQTLTRLAAFAVGTMLARVFGAERFGEYMYVMTFVMYFAFLADAGLGRYLIRDGAREPGRAREFFATIGALRLGLAALVYGLMLGAALLTRADGERLTFIAVAGLSLFTGALSGAFCSLFNAREEMRVTAVFGVVSTACNGVLVLAALAAGLGLAGVFAATALANLPPLAYLIVEWWRRLGRPRLAVDPPLWRAALRRSFPYALLGVIGLVYFRIDALMLTWLKGPEATGIYTAAYRLLDAVTDVPGVIVAAMFPALARLHIESKPVLKRAYLGAIGTLTVLGLPVLVGMILLARPLILLLYGAEFEPSVLVLQVLAVAVFLIFVDTANTMVLYAGDNLRPVVLLSLVTTSANVLLNLALIPRYGEVGAAAATGLSTALSISIFTPVVLRSLRR
jgi:O-antigen/teichoic acid export membrane protein